MKFIVVSNGTKEGTFVRNADTGEALEGVEHIALNYDGEKCVTTIKLATGWCVVNNEFGYSPYVDKLIPKAPDTSKGLPEDDGFLDPAAALNALKALDKGAQVDYGMGLRRCEDCNVVLSEGACSGRVSAHGLCPECGERAPHAHHKEEGGVHLSTKHIPRSPADIATELEKDPGNESLRKELGDAIDKGVDYVLSAIGHKVPKPPAKTADYENTLKHASDLLGASVLPKPDPLAHCLYCSWARMGEACRVPDPFAHCTYCKLYYCDASSDHSCMEASDHQHKWVPPFTAFKPPPVLPTRIDSIGAAAYGTLVKQYPHCDDLVLHPRGACEFCDLPINEPLHVWRELRGVNHTGENDPGKLQCPAEARRSKEIIDKWYGNTAKPKEGV